MMNRGIYSAIRHQAIKAARKLANANCSRHKKTLTIQNDPIEQRLEASAFTAIYQTAASSSDEEIGARSVIELSTEANCQRQAMLVELARGNSSSAIHAIVALLKLGYAIEALAIFKQRSENGELLNLTRNNKESAFQLLNILGCIDDEEGSQSLCYFPELLRRLNEQERKYLLARILGDPRPNGPRYQWQPNRIAPAVKLRSINVLLGNFQQDEAQRPLLFAANDSHQPVARLAIESLINSWGKQETAQSGSCFQEFNVMLETCGFLLEHQGDARQKSMPLQALQLLTDRICAKYALPAVRIMLNKSRDRDGAYHPGRGTIEISVDSNQSGQFKITDELFSTLLHELQHLEQDALVLKSMAIHCHLNEAEKRNFRGESKRELALLKSYSAWTGAAPDLSFVRRILNAGCRRTDLSPSQMERAARLYNDVLSVLDKMRKFSAHDMRPNPCRSKLRRSASDAGDGGIEEKLVALRCTGLHEAEAAQVSDGIEIILKALHNGYIQTALY